MSLPDSATEGIKKEIENQIAAGVDFTDKQKRREVLKQLAEKFNVNYSTALKAYLKLAKEQTPPSVVPQPPAEVTAGTGVRVDVTEKPPPTQPMPGVTEQISPTVGVPTVEVPTTKLTDEQFKTVIRSMLMAPSEFVYKFGENLYGVKVDRPEQKDWDDTVEITSIALKAYGVDLPKFVLLIGAVAKIGSMYILPLAEAKSRHDSIEKKRKEEQVAATLATEEETKKKKIETQPSFQQKPIPPGIK